MTRPPCACGERMIGPYLEVSHHYLKCVGFLYVISLGNPGWVALDEALSPNYFRDHGPVAPVSMIPLDSPPAGE